MILFVAAVTLAPLAISSHGATFSMVHAQATDGGADSKLDACASVSNYNPLTWSGACFIQSLIVSLGAGIVSLLATIPFIADKLLQFVIDNTVLTSGFTSLYGTFSQAVGTAWTFIRDLTNIAIIGIFVFVAICIILGIQSFGQKKFIANILVVAILINFSYLFTIIIINFSNGLSTNIYNQLLLKKADGGGVGNKFLKDLRVTTLSDASKTYKEIYTKTSIGNLLMHVLVATIVCLGAGFSLFFAAFLLIARFVMLVFLLLTSSAAFASFMIPSTASWWSTWWSTLFKNAFLAPIMFMFMAIALNMSDALSSQLARNGAFGDIGTGAIQNSSISLLVNYFLVLGMLLAGIIIANRLSTHAATRIVGSSALFSAGLAGVAGSFGANFGAYRMQKLLEAQKDRLKKNTTMDPVEKQRRLMELGRGIERYKAGAKKDFNPLNSSALKGLTKSLGLSGAAAGQLKTASYGKLVEDKAKKLAAQAGHAEISKEETNKISSNATKTERDHANNLEAEKTQRKQELDAIKGAAEAQKKAAEEEGRAAKQQMENARGHRESELQRIREERQIDVAEVQTAGPGSAAARDRITRNAQRAEQIMREREEKITEAGNAARAIEQRLQQISNAPEITAAQQRFNQAANRHQEALGALAQKTKAVKDHFDGYSDTLNDTVKSSAFNPDVGNEATKQIKAHHKHESIKKVLEAAGHGADHGDGHGDSHGHANDNHAGGGAAAAHGDHH